MRADGWSSGDAAARAVVGRLLGGVSGGVLEVVDARGRASYGRRQVASGSAQPVRAKVTVHDPRLYARILRGGSAALGESYADGDWDADDLTAFLRLAHRSLARTHAPRDRAHHAVRPLVDAIARLRSVDKQRDARNVRAHYDLGEPLFRRLLDDTMMYSCAIFGTRRESLESASITKIDRLARMLELGPGDRVLEIGTGWGGFAVHAARRYGCHVTTTTTSLRQYGYARERVRRAGLDDRVTVCSDDYRDIRGEFDKVIAIEMIEAVDWREYDAFFTRCRELVSDSGIVALQAIVLPDRSFDRAKHHTDFIKRAIFPGGCLPSVAALTSAASSAGFSFARLDDIGLHYAETLRRWRAHLLSRRDELVSAGYDDRFVRLWDFYFSYCEAGFEERYISTAQLAFTAPEWRPAAFRARTRRPRHLASAPDLAGTR
jgi:cyclopropane-fatty-acyl-phospholipid synthase